MKKVSLLFCLYISIIVVIYGQTPTYYVHNPSNMGVNNLFMHNSVTKKFLFIYDKSELNAAGISGATSFTTIWFRMNNSGTCNLSNCVITIGHTTLTATTPSTTFASNFNVGAPTTVLSVNPLNYSFIAGAWNVPTNNWSPITLSTPFVYNDVNNLAVMIEFSSQSGGIPSMYASNTGTTRYTNVVGGATASSSTSRPAFGISGTPSLFNTPELKYSIKQNQLVLQTILSYNTFLKQELAYSTTNGESWTIAPLPSIHEEWAINVPVQKTLYRMYFTDKDGNKQATNIIEVDEKSYQNKLTIYPVINNGVFTIMYPDINYGDLQITDLAGKIVHNIAPNTQQNEQIQVNLPVGIYFIQDKKQGKALKMIIQ